MLFSSWIFVIFFVVTFAVFLALRPTRLWVLWLLVASYFFYGWMNPLYLVLIGYSTLLNYGISRVMPQSPRKKWWLALSVLNGIFLLGFFKYGAFIVDNLNYLFDSFNILVTLHKPGKLFPVGISFYTFIILGYMIDLYRGKFPPEKNIIHFATFVSFFPYLLAGPIERAQNLLPQLKTAPKITAENITEGFSLFIVGAVQKNRSGGFPRPLCEQGFRRSRPLSGAAVAYCHLRVRLADILRFQRVYRHGARVRKKCSDSI